MTGEVPKMDQTQGLMGPKPGSPRGLVLAAGITLALIVIAPVIVDYNGGHKAPVAGAVALAALVVFACVLNYLASVKKYALAESFRHTIAATFLIVYLLLVSYNTFFMNALQIRTAATVPLSQELRALCYRISQP
jgi:hypothetical protein